jgi:hypothetical protein
VKVDDIELLAFEHRLYLGRYPGGKGDAGHRAAAGGGPGFAYVEELSVGGGASGGGGDDFNLVAHFGELALQRPNVVSHATGVG